MDSREFGGINIIDFFGIEINSEGEFQDFEVDSIEFSENCFSVKISDDFQGETEVIEFMIKDWTDLKLKTGARSTIGCLAMISGILGSKIRNLVLKEKSRQSQALLDNLIDNPSQIQGVIVPYVIGSDFELQIALGGRQHYNWSSLVFSGANWEAVYSHYIGEDKCQEKTLNSG
jgi:hypothetical protein